MTPIEIEVLLRFWYDPFAESYDWNQGQQDFIQKLLRRDILYHNRSGPHIELIANHDALAAYIDAICKIPLPTQTTVWVVNP